MRFTRRIGRVISIVIVLTISAMPADLTPSALGSSSGGEDSLSQNVLVGDVGLCSEQSNDQTGLREPESGEAEVRDAARQTGIRSLSTPTRAEMSALADQIERSLFEHELGFFYPACIDAERGGFRHATPAEWATFHAECRGSPAIDATVNRGGFPPAGSFRQGSPAG